MKLPPRYVTIFGLIVAILAAFTDPTIAPMVTELLGANASAKVAALGAVIASLGRALIPPSEPPTSP